MVWGRVDLRVSVRLPGSFQNNIWKPTRWRVQLWIPCHGKIKSRRHLRKRSRSEKQQRHCRSSSWSSSSLGPPTMCSLSWRPSLVLDMRSYLTNVIREHLDKYKEIIRIEITSPLTLHFNPFNETSLCKWGGKWVEKAFIELRFILN